MIKGIQCQDQLICILLLLFFFHEKINYCKTCIQWLLFVMGLNLGHLSPDFLEKQTEQGRDIYKQTSLKRILYLKHMTCHIRNA